MKQPKSTAPKRRKKARGPLGHEGRGFAFRLFWLRMILKSLSLISVNHAARYAEGHILRPNRYDRPDWEEKNLASAEQLRLPYQGKELVLWRWGEAERRNAPPVLLIHGWAGRGSQMSDFAPALLEAGFQPYCLDAPAHGDSPWGPISMADYAHVLIALEDWLGQSFYGLVGHSMGGTTAVLAAHMGLDCRMIVTIGSPMTPHGFLRHAQKLLGLSPALMQALQARATARTGIDWSEIDLGELSLKIDNLRLLVLHDEEDRAVPVEQARAIAAAAPQQTELVITQKLGHRRILRDAAVHHIVADFMQRGTKTDPPR